MTEYAELSENLKVISENVKYNISILSNASALIWEYMDRLNWCGFYLIEDDKLILGPFQGKVACTEIQMGKGVCGTAAIKDETILVEDVHSFDGHIACDSASNSEIVVPIHKDGVLFGVLDIDSPVPARFTAEDKNGLELAVSVLEEVLE